jgi:hypothetical protein
MWQIVVGVPSGLPHLHRNEFLEKAVERRRDEVTEHCRELHDEEHRNLWHLCEEYWLLEYGAEYFDRYLCFGRSLRAGWPRGQSSSPSGVKIFLFSRSSSPLLRSTQPPIQWVPGALSPGVKRPGREVEHSPPSSAEIKRMWIYTSTPHTPSWRSA